MSGRVAQVGSIKLYLEAHPELEVPGVLTGVIAGDLHTTAVTAMSDLGIALQTHAIKPRNGTRRRCDSRSVPAGCSRN